MDILVNRTDFDQSWAASELIDFIHPQDHVYVMAITKDDGYSQDYDNYSHTFSNTSEMRYDLKRPFISYGIPENHIHFFDQYYDSRETVMKYLRQCQIVLLACEDTEDLMNYLEDHELVSVLRNYTGTFISASAATKVVMNEYYYQDPYDGFISRNGIGRIHGYDVDPHYIEDDYHLSLQIHVLQQSDLQMIVLPKIGAVTIDHGRMSALGGAFLVEEKDLDELYQLYQRQDDVLY